MYCYIKYSDPLLPEVLSLDDQLKQKDNTSFNKEKSPNRKNKSQVSVTDTIPKEYSLTAEKLNMVSARSKTNDTTSNYTNRSSKVSFEFSSKLRQSMALNAGQTNKVLLVNPDCYIQILVDYLYEEMGLDVKTKFDFSDENGTLMNIDKLKPHQFATLVLQHKQTYVAVVYEKDENDCYTRLEPLLIKSTKQEADLYLKILKNLIEVKKPSVGSLNQKGSKSASSVSGKKSTKSSSKGNIRKRVNSASQRSKQSVKSD